jgi:hypothetical protein
VSRNTWTAHANLAEAAAIALTREGLLGHQPTAFRDVLAATLPG